MTRKRFIKLLMSHGETPKSARTIAFLYNSRKIPYKKAYSDYLLKTSFKRAMSRMASSAVKVTKSFPKLAAACNKMATSLRGAFNG